MTSVVEPGGERTCLVLVDYDNAFPPSEPLTPEEVALEVELWIRRLSTRYTDVARIEMRLYGGWYDDADLSRQGSLVVQILSRMPEFPIRLPGGRILRGEIALASWPLVSARSSPLLGTYRRRSSLPRIRLNKQPYPDNCAKLDSTCPAAILRAFTRTNHRACPTEACTTLSSEAFVTHEQKMVDTMLATDLLTASQHSSTDSIVVVISGDSDFLPPLLAANSIGGNQLAQLRPRVHESSEYATSVLEAAGVEVI